MNGALDLRILRVDVSTPTYPDSWMLVDEAFYEAYCTGRKWTRDNTGYAVANVAGKKIEFHRLILQGKPGQDVDHINRNRLDNRIANLRLISRSANTQNSPPKAGAKSPFKGVHPGKKDGRWTAQIRRDGKNQHLGTFDNQVDAARAYNQAAIELHGPHAWTNDV